MTTAQRNAGGGAAAADAAAVGTPGPVLAVLEDSAAGALLIECSAALAHVLGRQLALVQVQSTLALQAAALPHMQVLAHAGASWAPFAPPDVERGWRAQAARLQALAGTIASRHDLPWSLRAVRGEMTEVVRTLLPESDLLFVGAAAWLLARAAPVRVVTVLDDGDASAVRALDLATRMAAAMPATWRVRQLPASGGAALDALLRQPHAVDALVLPRRHATPARWALIARLRCPVLLVG